MSLLNTMICAYQQPLLKQYFTTIPLIHTCLPSSNEISQHHEPHTDRRDRKRNLYHLKCDPASNMPSPTKLFAKLQVTRSRKRGNTISLLPTSYDPDSDVIPEIPVSEANPSLYTGAFTAKLGLR